MCRRELQNRPVPDGILKFQINFDGAGGEFFDGY